MSFVADTLESGSCGATRSSSRSIWHKSAPLSLQASAHNGRRADTWAAWQRYLADRESPGLAMPQPEKNDRDLGWGVPSASGAALSRPWAHDDETAVNEAARQWLEEATENDSLLQAIKVLGWCRHLPSLAQRLPGETWWQVLDHLVAIALKAQALRVPCEGDPVSHQILAGELPLTLASFFPEIRACRALAKKARKILFQGLDELLDDHGVPHANRLACARPLLACWTRCRALARPKKRGGWHAQREKQYRRFVYTVLRLTRCDGGAVMNAAPSSAMDLEMLRAAVASLDHRQDRMIAVRMLSGRELPRKHRKKKKKTPKASFHSEWAGIAVLRADWSRATPRLTALYSDAACRLELACGNDVLCSGEWSFEVRVDGALALPQSEWSETCWVSDEDVDYLELEISLGREVRVQRHMLVARRDRFVLLADAVLTDTVHAVEYRGALPLTPSTTTRTACDTREIALVQSKPRAVVLPLGLSEWLDDRSDAGLSRMASALELRQTANGGSLFAPLFLDFHPQRMCRPLTWRPLTVAESLVAQPAGKAVAYRIALGKKQWVLYRSLTPPRNRTFLGHNLSSEMLVARFRRDGEVESLIEIE